MIGELYVLIVYYFKTDKMIKHCFRKNEKP